MKNVKQMAFKEIIWTVSHNILLAYPDFNKLFDTHTDNRYLQLGLLISQNIKLITLYSRKLTRPQKRYMVE